MLSKEEQIRYDRHIRLSEIGQAGQEKLHAAKVLVIGAGGLGGPVLQYISAAGVGTIGIVDDDKVDQSNLQRQVLFSADDIGLSKAEIAADKLSKQNPHVNFTSYKTRLTSQNALNILKDYDIVVDGSDNFPTRYLINDACVMLKKPLVFGSIFKFEGQVSVFNFNGGPTYRCLFPEPPGPGEVPNCSEIGVLGVLPGLIGTIQANETLKIILGIGEVLSGQLLMLNALTMNMQHLKFNLDPENLKIDHLIDYEEFCGVQAEDVLNEITVQELKQWLEQNKDIQLIDVREAFEYDICHLANSHLIPLNTVPQNSSKISKEKPVVMICHHGQRSAAAIHMLSDQGYKNLYNLQGGIHKWAVEVDPGMGTY